MWALDISPQCLYFATGSQDRTARLWNLEYTFPLRIFAGHLQDVDVSANPCERSRQAYKVSKFLSLKISAKIYGDPLKRA